MGVDIQFALSLIHDHKHFAGKADSVMLGRRRWAMRKRHNALIRRTLRAVGLPRDMDQLAGEDGFAEPFFDLIGLADIKSMDMSAYEACDVVHDLNEPPPDDLRDRFDVIIDGGTIEHVFNTPQALDTVFHMLRDDGIFISINGMTGWAGHGFYQFSPEIVCRYWAGAARKPRNGNPGRHGHRPGSAAETSRDASICITPSAKSPTPTRLSGSQTHSKATMP